MEENLDNKLKSECTEIKEQINPPEELINKTILKVREVEEKRRYKGKKHTLLLQKIVAVFVTSVVLVEGAAFAFKQQDVLSLLFSNIDKGIETAIEDGNVHNIDMDYLDVDGLKFKVEFVLMNEYNFDLVLKFDNADEYAKANGINNLEDIVLIDPIIKANDDMILYADYLSLSNFKLQKCIEVNGEKYIILHGFNSNNTFPVEKIEKISIDKTKIKFLNNDEKEKYIEYNNNIEIDLKGINIDNVKTNYILDDDRIEKYNIVLSSTNLKVELYFKDENVMDFDIKNSYLKDGFRKKYFCNSSYIYDDKYLNITFPISNYQEIKDLKLYLKFKDKFIKTKITRGD